MIRTSRSTLSQTSLIESSRFITRSTPTATPTIATDVRTPEPRSIRFIGGSVPFPRESSLLLLNRRCRRYLSRGDRPRSSLSGEPERTYMALPLCRREEAPREHERLYERLFEDAGSSLGCSVERLDFRKGNHSDLPACTLDPLIEPLASPKSQTS